MKSKEGSAARRTKYTAGGALALALFMNADAGTSRENRRQETREEIAAQVECLRAAMPVEDYVFIPCTGETARRIVQRKVEGYCQKIVEETELGITDGNTIVAIQGTLLEIGKEQTGKNGKKTCTYRTIDAAPPVRIPKDSI